MIVEPAMEISDKNLTSSHYQYQYQQAKILQKARYKNPIPIIKQTKQKQQQEQEKEQEQEQHSYFNYQALSSIAQLLEEGKKIIISHSNWKPLNLQLLAKHLSGMANVCILEQYQDIRNFLLGEFQETQQKQQQKRQKQKQESRPILLSLFNMNYLLYKPCLIKFLMNVEQMRKNGNHKDGGRKFIIYCSKIEEENVKEIISQVEQRIVKGSLNFQTVQYNVQLPFDYAVSSNLLDILEKFLNDQLKQSSKKHVIIFHQPTEQYLKKLFYLTKTKGFHIFTKIIHSVSSSSSLNPPSATVCHIYLCQNSQTLKSLNPSLSSTYLILDYEQDSYYYFNYVTNCYTAIPNRISYEQKYRRMNVIAGNIGMYACGEEHDFMDKGEERGYQDYGGYCLQMGEYGLKDWLEWEGKANVAIKACVGAIWGNAKGEIGLGQGGEKGKQARVNGLVREGMNVFLVRRIVQLTDKEKIKLMLIVHAILCSEYLRNQQIEKPNQIWHKSGYLQSSLDIIMKYLQFTLSQKDSGIQKQQLIHDFQIVEQSLDQILNYYQKYCRLFQVQKQLKNYQLSQEQFFQILQQLLLAFRPAVATYSGSRRLGYLLKSSQTGVVAHKKSLLNYFNQKPNFILITKILQTPQGTPLIYHCNYIPDQLLISTYGCLPTLSRQSFGQCELEFPNISSAVFTHLSKFNSLQITQFELEHNCSIQTNPDLSTITIQCQKQSQSQIHSIFSSTLQSIIQMLKNQSKSFNQSKNLVVILSQGGEISNFIIKQDDKCGEILDMGRVRNLADQVGIEELKDLVDQFVQLRDIRIVEKREGMDGKDSMEEGEMGVQKRNREAVVYFYSNEDFVKFYQYFNGCEYYGEIMIVLPYVQEKIQQEVEDSYLLFEWNAWKSLGQAFIQFQKSQQAKSAIINLKNLAGPQAKIQQNVNMLFISGLDPNIDEKQLAKWLMGQGTIIRIQVRRFPPKTLSQQGVSIKSILKNAFKQDIDCIIEKVQKKKNGNRSCKVKLTDRSKMQQIYFVLNEGEGILGTGKLYATPMYTYPLKLPQPTDLYIKVYTDIIKDISIQLSRLNPLQIQIQKNPLQYTIIIKSNSQQQMKVIKMYINERVKGQVLNLNLKDSSLLFTDLALKNFQMFQRKLPVKIVPNMLEKNIKVLCRPSLFGLIQKEINTQIMESFTYQISLYQKAYLFVQKNVQEILSQQIKANLKMKFKPIKKNLQLQGNLFTVEKAREKIAKSLKKLRKQSQQNMDESNTCGLCCEQMKHPFKLQNCAHTFCYDCLQNSIRYTIQDISLYPIKCPQCMQKIWISDLQCLLDQPDWQKIFKTSINHFIFSHPGEYCFCLTAGCTFIVPIKHKSFYTCKQCKKSYCLACNNQSHPGMTCHEARYGSDRLFHEFMATVGGRICANKECKAPIQRISGCFKVQCSRCKKCMCFKCPPNSMVAYNTPEETYNHLNRVHGGCF